MSAKKESRLDSYLHVGARQGDVARLQKILDSGRVHVDSKDQDGTTPLMLGCSHGQVEAVKLLLREGADPNIRKVSGVSAAFLACQGGYLDILELLMAAGADIDAQSQEGGTALMVSSQAGHLDIVEYLVMEGVNLNLNMWDGATALFLAAQNGNTSVVEKLAASEGVDLDHQRRDGASPLWIAAQMDHPQIVSILLKAGAKVDQSRGDGATPLYKACQKGHKEVVDVILKHKPNLGLLQNGESCVHAAAVSGDPDIVHALIKAGGDPNLASISGATPLDMAVGEARLFLQKVTTQHGLGPKYLSRSLTPDKLSALRSGASMFFRKRLEHKPQSPLASPMRSLSSPSPSSQTSPLASPLRNPLRGGRTRSPSTCPPTPVSIGTPGSSPAPATHSVQFTDPPLLKDGVIVTKVQCKILEARDILSREKSPVRLINLSPMNSPVRSNSAHSAAAENFCDSSQSAYYSPMHNGSSSLARSSRTH